MNNAYVGQRCNCCGKVFTAEDEFIICPACFAPHHVSCWLDKQGCSTEGCSEQSAAEKARLERKKNAEKIAAAETAKVAAEHSAAPKPAPAAVPVSDAAPAGKSSKMPLVIAAVTVGVIILIVLLTKGKVNFRKLYDEYCVSTWATLGSDGSYLFIDTNPYDRDDDGLAYPAAYEAIKKVNNALGLPDSLITEMEKTTALDGRQSQSFDKKGITVAWKYHPDAGLEVTYKKNK